LHRGAGRLLHFPGRDPQRAVGPGSRRRFGAGGGSGHDVALLAGAEQLEVVHGHHPAVAQDLPVTRLAWSRTRD
jgi:hypothetical protein